MNELAPIETELVQKPTTATLVPVTSSSTLVRPAAGLDHIKEAFQEYGRVCDELLDASDYQRISDKQFRKKSAWRKLAVAFGVSCEILSREYDRDANNKIIRAEVVVRATAPNGRMMDGLGACDVFERCCSKPCSKARYNDHRCCQADCDGANHFSHAQHDVPATAATRATNRACADLFGFGEVSAEEVVGEGEPRTQQAPSSSGSGPTEKQLNYLSKLLDEKVAKPQHREVVSRLAGREIAHKADLSKSECAKVIDALVQNTWQQSADESTDGCQYCGCNPCECAVPS